MLCLRILQAALVYINTLMIQDILADPEWADLLSRRGPARPDPAVLAARPPLRRGRLDMGSRLQLHRHQPADPEPATA